VKKVEIKLHGILGKELGRRFFSLAVSSVSEALHAINILTSNKLNRVLNKHGYDKFNVVINGRTIRHDKVLDPKDPNVYKEISNSELVLKTNKLETIDIIPVIEASDSDIFAIILGVILIIAGIFTLGTSTGIGVALIMGGIGIAAAGIINLLSKPPSFEPFQEIAGVTKKSYLFNGPENTVGEGGVVPVGYGRLIVGSQTVSASYDIYNVPVDNGTANSPNNENVINAWYFRTSEHINFNDPVKKINYYAVSKLSGRGNLVITGTKDTRIASYIFNNNYPRPTNTLKLPQEVFVNFLQNSPGTNNADPTLTLTINNLIGYQITPEKNEDAITEESVIKRYNVKVYFFSQSIQDFNLTAISGGTFDSVTKEEGGTVATIDSGSISYPYPIANGSVLSATLVQVNNFIPTSDTFSISFKNDGSIVSVPVIILEKAVQTSFGTTV
jgi:predicted phage tail protein